MSRKRIVSLLPSATEIVYALDCGRQLVGRSHECDFPPEVRDLPICSKPKIKTDVSSREIDQQVQSLLQSALSIYEIDTTKLKELQPDIILTQAQCEVCAVSAADLEKAISESLDFRPQIISLSPQRLADVWNNIQTVAEALEVQGTGKEVVKKLKNRVVDVIEKTCPLKNRPNVACIEWLDPLMAAGNWVPELVDFAGGRNLFGEPGKHSPWLDWETLKKRDPSIIILMPCGFDIPRGWKEFESLQCNPEWKKLRAVRNGKAFIVDGSHFFNRPGPRLVESLEILAEIIQPTLFSFEHEGTGWQKI